MYDCCLVPVLRFPGPSSSIQFGDLSEANGRKTSREKQLRCSFKFKMLDAVVSGSWFELML